MPEIVEYIPDLKGIDAEIFLENLDKEITQEEIKKVRKWALVSCQYQSVGLIRSIDGIFDYVVWLTRH